ncbi:uracil-DNA glycosylase [Gallionella capsiferriformans]|jgi:uracil-DNA glycosylase|uniref:Uracil-DNA glycosylase n=1 Tax=Gallionella capsiferriformans (strain ES-2) TaxID=395494 RepID=D9SGV7_GALCS|nr:uracil-DNA glycosylase [Gallionella capsiferriformans]ADL55754.1 uracil-DNA glycosylase [Gallionella capsiferriformans ES-2]
MKTTWRPLLIEETHKPYFGQLQQFIAEQREKHTVFPPEADVYAALHLTPIEEVRVFILGQDPYHDDHQAHGLCFSVRPGVSIPPSLLNIFKELKADLGCQIPNNGCLIPWARQGVLLLNAVLTVEAHHANSHKARGWETFTDAVIAAVNAKTDPVVFVLWGAYARKKIGLIDQSRHVVIESPHPSPLSAYRGFFGSRPFSKINAALTDAGRRPIDWQITDL